MPLKTSWGRINILISGNAFTTINGSDDFDILAMEEGIGPNLDGGGESVSHIEIIDTTDDDAANSLTLTAGAVESLTDVVNQL